MKNKLKANNFVWVLLACQAATFILVWLGIPGLRQLAGFLYLTFIPGFLIVRLLKLNKAGAIETLLYSVGLSLAFIMFLGFIINIIYPLIGILRPISALPLIVSFVAVTAVLTIVLLKREGNFSLSLPFEARELISPQVLFLILLPLLSSSGPGLCKLT